MHQSHATFFEDRKTLDDVLRDQMAAASELRQHNFRLMPVRHKLNLVANDSWSIVHHGKVEGEERGKHRIRIAFEERTTRVFGDQDGLSCEWSRSKGSSDIEPVTLAVERDVA